MASPSAWADPEPTYHGSRHSGEGPLKKRCWYWWVETHCPLPGSCFLRPQVRIPSRVDKLESSPPKQCDQEVGSGVEGGGPSLSSVPGLDGWLLYLTSLPCGCPKLGKARGGGRHVSIWSLCCGEGSGREKELQLLSETASPGPDRPSPPFPEPAACSSRPH